MLQQTPRDLQILDGLLRAARVFSLRQVSDHWWNGDFANARRRLKQLAQDELLQPITLAARPLPPLESPVVSWQPGREEPDFGAVSYQLTSRWQGRAVRTMAGFLATEKAGQILGGKGRSALPHPLQATHDLGVAAIWLHFRLRVPTWAAAWRGEDLMAGSQSGQKLPDAFLVDGNDRTFGVIEFGGSYDIHRVRDFHQHCFSHSLPYQIW
jgi:hypothetical protein